MAGVNYPELGGVDSKKVFYSEGDEYTHPSGYVYKLVKQRWRPIRDPSGKPIEEGQANA